MESQRFSQQLTFLTQVDKMKNILRQTLLAEGSRRETDAEHSWHFALMAMVLYEYCALPHVDLNRVLKMALVHDLVEIYAGDTFCYDQAANQDKALREKESTVFSPSCRKIRAWNTGSCGRNSTPWRPPTPAMPRPLTVSSL